VNTGLREPEVVLLIATGQEPPLAWPFHFSTWRPFVEQMCSNASAQRTPFKR
jgi:hypothetical protein